MVQPQINSLVVSERFDYALRILENSREGYGPQNSLLYYLDYGLVLHQAKKYEQSIAAFEQAKKEFDKYFTVSVSGQAKTWFINDNTAPYRGEDFERVMINIFQALNYVSLGDYEEALVEARDVDVKLSAINRQYDEGQENVYQEDAFVRFFMGIIYEARGRREDYNDAFISYVKATEIYDKGPESNYDVQKPNILIENLLSVAQFMGADDLAFYRNKYPNASYVSLEEKKKRAEVYVICYYGLSPVKRQAAIPIPSPGGYVAKLAFARYDQRHYEPSDLYFKALRNDQSRETLIEPVQNISAIALEGLANRQKRVIAKAVLRSGGKYALERYLEGEIRDNYGRNTSDAFRYISSLYNISSEKADLRSWQTLPGEIRVGRLLLDPGEYELFVNSDSVETHTLKAGETKFIIHRMTR